MTQPNYRQDFPALQQCVYGRPLVYLDSAATSQKPQLVIDAMTRFYTEDCANVHRGVHALSERASAQYEGARDKVQKFIGARQREEIIFARGTTEAINLVAHSFVAPLLEPGDKVLITELEHHSNIVPWQVLCEERGARLKVMPVEEDGSVSVELFASYLSPRTRFVSIAHVSNALGTILPVKEIIALARGRGIPVMLDGAQAVSHMPVDVLDLDCDFYAFSAHKCLGPTGMGVLYGKRAHLERMKPYQTGGDMIASVRFEKTTYAPLPAQFEAGTPHIAGAIGLGAAIDYMQSIGFDAIHQIESDLLSYGTARLQEIPGLRLIGTAPHKAGVLSFVMDEIHPHDISTILDRQGVAIRAGHLCAQPIVERFGVAALARASLLFYNTRADIDALCEGLIKVKKLLCRTN